MNFCGACTSRKPPKTKNMSSPNPVEPVEPTTTEENTLESVESKPSKQPNAWHVHVMHFKREHPDLQFKDVLRQAKATYVKKTPQQVEA